MSSPAAGNSVRRGATIFFTGLPGAGKTTLARALEAQLTGPLQRTVTMLDGDSVRRYLTGELGFSREHRDLNVLRIGYVATQIVRHAGIAVCAAIAPYAQTRRQVRSMIAPHGVFIEVYVSTPLETCEARDPKGLYAQARAGLIEHFTGVSDPYEAPQQPEIAIDTRSCAPEEAARRVLDRLAAEGCLR